MARPGELTIGRVAAEAGVNVETIRFYERKGLIVQPRKPAFGGYRSYPEQTVFRLKFIRAAQRIGFSLNEIMELLSLRADPVSQCRDVQDRARVKLAEVDRKMVQLESIRNALRTLIAACPGDAALRECSIIQALDEAAEFSTEIQEQQS